jgi:hypothetical protein
MSEALWLFVVIGLVGLIGSFFVVRKTSGAGTVFGCLGWLALPLVIIAILVAFEIDPSAPATRPGGDYAFNFIMISLVVGTPWFLAACVGGLVGLITRKGKPAPQAAAPVAPAPPSDPDLPDWRHADNPSLSLAELGDRMYAIADRAGIERHGLPHVGPIEGGDGVFLDRDKFDYIFMGIERGQPMFDHRSVVADEILYLVFRDRAWAIGANYLAHNRASPEHYAELLKDKQQEALARIDPRWGRQFARERRG